MGMGIRLLLLMNTHSTLLLCRLYLSRSCRPLDEVPSPHFSSSFLGYNRDTSPFLYNLEGVEMGLKESQREWVLGLKFNS